MVKVSVIIPVYNASQYLERCIDSLLKQTLTSCEFIFINDGSTDSSLSILEHYLEKDVRVKLVSQENKGVSAARNAGLKIASGDYIGFVDADDFIEKDYFEKLYSASKGDLDVVVCHYSSVQDGYSITSKHPFQTDIVLDETYIKKEIIPFFISNESINSSCTKLYKRKVIDEFSIQFPIGVALGEDGLFNSNFFSKSKKVCFINYIGYHYVEVLNSATRKFDFTKYFERIIQESKHDYSNLENEFLNTQTIEFLKAEKYITKIISLCHLCHALECNFTKNQVDDAIIRIVKEPVTIKIIDNYYTTIFTQKSNYEKVILFGIKYKLVFLISWVIRYSNYRNKK